MAGLHLRNMSASFCESKTLATGDAGSGGARASTMIGITGSLYLTTGSGNRNAATPGGSRSGCGYLVLPGVMGVKTPMSGNLSLFAQGYGSSAATHLWVKDSAGNTTDLSAGSAIDGSGTSTELTYWQDSDTIGGITNFTSDGTNVTKLTTDATADILLESSFNSATAIKLLTNAGTTEQIVVTNTLGTNAAAIDINASAGGIELDAAGAIAIESSAGTLSLGADAVAQAINIGSGAAARTITVGNAASTKVDVNALIIELDSAGTIVLDSTTTTTIGATTTMDLDAAGALSINSSAAAINIGNDDIDQAINIGTQGERTVSISTGAFASTLAMGNATGATAVTLDAGTGGIDIDCNGATGALALDTAGGDIEIGHNAAAGDMNIGTNATARTIALGNATGATALDIDAGTGGLTLDSTGIVSIDGADDMNFTITSGGAGEDLTIAQVGGNDSSIIITAAGTGADAVSIDATAGSMVIAPSLIDGKTLTVGNTSSTYLKLTPHGTPASERVDLYNATGTADDAIKIHADAGGVSIVADDDSLFLDANGTDADALNIDSAGGVDVDAAGAVAIDSTAGSITMGAVLANGQTLTIGPSSATQMVFSPHGTAASEKISLTNTSGTADDAISIVSTAGGVTVQAGNDSLRIDADGTDADALNIDSAGGMDVDVAGVLDMAAGDDSVIAVTTAAKDLALTVSGGGDQVLQLNSAGTGTAAIDINATAGGIDIDSAAAIDILAATTFSIDGTGNSNVGVAEGNLTLATSTSGRVHLKGDTIRFYDVEGAGMYVLEIDPNASAPTMLPTTDNLFDLGSATKRFANIYTGDLHLANDRGNYTLVEEEDMLTIRNNRSGKWFKLMMEEIDPTGRDEGMQGAVPVLADSNDWEI